MPQNSTSSCMHIPATLTGEIGGNTPNSLNGLGGGREVPVLGRGNPPLTGVLGIDLQGVLALQLGELLLNELVDTLVGLLLLHVGDCSDGELSDNLGRDHSLGT